MILIYAIIAGACGYFLGAIPFGKIYVKLATGKDVEKVGSGRTGGTNSLRAAGWPVGFITAMSDVGKGFAGVMLTRYLLGGVVDPATLPWLEITAGILGVIGHNWSIYINFNGGAGTGPNVGWATAVWAPIFPIAFTVMLSMIYLLGWASVASMTMALIIPVSFGWLYLSGAEAVMLTPAYIVGGLITAGIVAFSLRGNFVRLFRGEERVVGLRAQLARRREEKERDKEKADLSDS